MSTMLALFAVLPWAWSVLLAILDRRHGLSLDAVEPLSEGPLVSVVGGGAGTRAPTTDSTLESARALAGRGA